VCVDVLAYVSNLIDKIYINKKSYLIARK